jgi:hypothetical protein
VILLRALFGGLAASATHLTAGQLVTCRRNHARPSFSAGYTGVCIAHSMALTFGSHTLQLVSSWQARVQCNSTVLIVSASSPENPASRDGIAYFFKAPSSGLGPIKNSTPPPSSSFPHQPSRHTVHHSKFCT